MKYDATKLTKSITVTAIIIKIVCLVMPFLANGLRPIDLMDTTVDISINDSATIRHTNINTLAINV